MDPLFPLVVLFFGVVSCQDADVNDAVLFNGRPDACNETQTNGYIGDTRDFSSYYYCHKTGVGIRITCTPTGYEWNDDQQSCVPELYNTEVKSCKELPVVPQQNGTWKCTNDDRRVGTKCSLLCRPGYRLMDRKAYQPLEDIGESISVMCNRRTGRPSAWNHDVSELVCVSYCEPNPCGFGECSLDENEGTYNCTCDPGWEKNSVTQYRAVSGSCLTAVNYCDGVSCSDNGLCINDQLRQTHFCVCDAGWNGTNCDQQIRCPDLAGFVPGNTRSNPIPSSADFEYASNITVNCSEGYRLASNNSRADSAGVLTCGMEGLWLDAADNVLEIGITLCQMLVCRPPRPNWGNATYDSLSFDTNATLECDVGIDVSGDYRCQSDGSWGPATCVSDGTAPTPDPTNPDNGVDPTNPDNGGDPGGSGCVPLTVESAVVMGTPNISMVRCDDGWIVNGTTEQDTITVNCVNGVWEQHPGCIRTTCPDLSAADGVTISWSQVINDIETELISPPPTNDNIGINGGYRASFSCGNNLMLTGHTALDCTPRGWAVINATGEPTLPTCGPIRCDISYQSTFVNGEVSFTGRGNTGETSLAIACNEGFVISGEVATGVAGPGNAGTGSFQCTRDGNSANWVDTTDASIGFSASLQPTCVPIQCPELDNPADGQYSRVNGAFSDEVSLTCHLEHQAPSPAGAAIVRCDSNGQWAPINATCENITCVDIFIPNGRALLNGETPTSWPVGSNFTFECNAGFNYSHTSDYSIQCVRNGNISTGIYLGDRPTCNDLDNCIGIECGHGRCEDGMGTFTCVCQAGWTHGAERLCNNQTNPCEPNPCNSGQRCIINTDFLPNQYEYRCSCDPMNRYSGYNCHKDTQLPIPANICAAAQNGEKKPDPRRCSSYIACVGFNEQYQEQSCSDDKPVFDSTQKECRAVSDAARESLCTMNNN